ncbi:N-acetyltransferase [Aureibacter tunicatorum]|uniref:GNAT superfamily N-acetyltransferase n=1 Tax=Aureibacter tunicatorum TaxID=866807 RepID=A0AAE3XL20_9BACT|nr:GNAT family N-acetyltransferase [Aureibacter tunicatorum]MDR6238563.1 GNAT superfamily N-acetyltransferase [Aureibacter tunicatorum]BDD05506.1 GNAT family acetyltransferase [Aureibacter tunicatorum]
MEKIIELNAKNIQKEHICCAISDKKCKESYELKKKWLTNEFENGYKFYRLDTRAKVFIEYCDAEKSWVPIDASNYIFVGCMWVSGKYKGNGYAKALLQKAEDEAKQRGKSGLVTIVGTKKFHFMNDTKWLLKQGFEEADRLPYGFSLLVKKFDNKAEQPKFKKSVEKGECENTDGLTVYFSNRCPFSEYHVTNSLVETVKNRNLNLEVVKFETLEEAQNSPTPATIFSLYYNGKFITTDISVCMDSRFDKIIKKAIEK